MEITTKLLETIYLRAGQYAIARWNRKPPNKIEIDGDGSICVIWEFYRCGEYDTDYEYITAENLIEDLDAVVEKRKFEEEEARKADEIRRKEEELKRLAIEKEKRKQEYLKLKKEFE